MKKRTGFAPLPYGGSNAGNIKLAGWTRATREEPPQSPRLIPVKPKLLEITLDDGLVPVFDPSLGEEMKAISWDDAADILRIEREKGEARYDEIYGDTQWMELPQEAIVILQGNPVINGWRLSGNCDKPSTMRLSWRYFRDEWSMTHGGREGVQWLTKEPKK